MDGKWKTGTQTLLGKHEGKRPATRPKIKWENNIIWNLKEIDYEFDWKTLSQVRVTWRAYILAVMNLRIP